MDVTPLTCLCVGGEDAGMSRLIAYSDAERQWDAVSEGAALPSSTNL